jgi:hypothetical protein
MMFFVVVELTISLSLSLSLSVVVAVLLRAFIDYQKAETELTEL